MKKLVLYFLIIGLAFVLSACNTATGPSNDGGTTEITITDDTLYVLANDDEYPGAEVDLAKYSIEDISKYASVTVNATLYSDEGGETLAVKSNASDNLAQFTLLKASGDWNIPGNICGETKYNMAINGETTLNVKTDYSGVPGVLLLQANWEEFPGAVKSIKVNTIRFAPKSNETTITDGGLYEMANAGDYPGAEVDLAKFLAEGETLKDISEYANVIVNATLYSDTAGETLATAPPNVSDSLAQFKLLKTTGGWDDASNICSETKYNMVVEGNNTLTVTAGNSGVPAVLLLQANWVDFPDEVKSIRVNTITFTPKPPAGTVTLEELYDKGSYMEVNINSITFNDAMYSDCAALFAFPPDWGGTESDHAPLRNRTITFTYTIDPDHVCVPAGSPPDGTAIEHQIHIQAAHDDSSKDKYNGNNGTPGQVYKELDKGNGSFTIPANDLIAAAEATNNSDGNGPFVLNAVRIANNGTRWEESAAKIHYRCKSYTLVINSITIAP